MKKALIILFLNSLYCHLSGQISVDFTSNTRVGCGMVQVMFKNLSTGPIKSYSWNLGGIKSGVENPSRIFIAPGKYKVCLTVTGQDDKQETLCKDDFIEVKPSFKADFNADQTLVCSGTTVKFNDLTVSPNGKITSLIWDLGGSSGTVLLTNSIPVSSVYKDAGSYPITLYAKDEAGCESTITKKDLFRVLQKPEIKINNLPGTICNLPADLKLTNLSINAPELSFSWNFGNGTEFTGFDPPAVRFTQEGKFDLKVIATNSLNNCSDTLFRPGALVVEKMAKFSASRQQACQNEPIQFTSSTTILPESHQWTFGDGMSSTEANPQHRYAAPGCYTVTHITVYQGCTSTHVMDTCLRVHETPIANYTLNVNRGCQLPLLVQTTNNSTGGVQYTWKSNGVIISNQQNPLLAFDTPGNFPIQLEVTSSQGCSASVLSDSVEVYKIKPQISSGQIKGCGPLFYSLEHNSISLDPITRVKWVIFNPVTKVIEEPVAAVIIPEVGRYDVRLVVENALGCRDSIEEKQWIRVGNAPLTAMQFVGQQCFGIPLEALDKSDTTADEFTWDFGDGLPVEISKDVAKTYLDPNTYIIKHQAFSNGCAGNEVLGSVTILGAKAEFEIKNNCDLPGQKIFNNLSAGVDSITWDFGVNSISTDTSHRFNSNYDYQSPGAYSVLLKTFHRPTGCVDTALHTAYVSELKAGFTLSSKESCTPAQIQVINNSSSATQYHYEFKGAELLNADTSDPVIQYLKGGNYSGKLVVTDIIGCRDSFQMADSIRIHELQAQALTNHQNYCQDSLVLVKSDIRVINDRIKTYFWTYGQTKVDDKPELQLKIDSILTREVLLHVVTDGGCQADSKVNINSSYIITDFTSDTLLCTRDSIRFQSMITGPWNTILWKFGDGDTSRLIHPAHRYKSNGEYSVEMTVMDLKSGCKQTLVKNKSILIQDPVAVFQVLNTQEFCPPFVGRVMNQSQYASKYEWLFGLGSTVSTEFEPSHLFPESGNVSVRLVSKSSDLCSDTISLADAFVVHGPEVDFTKEIFPKICAPLPVNYEVTNNGVKQLGIEFGDGDQEIIVNPGNITQFKHTYDTGGLYYSVIFGTDSFGCTAIKLLDTIILHEVRPKVGFDNALICGAERYLKLLDQSKSSDPITYQRFSLVGFNYNVDYPNIPDSVLLPEYGFYSIKLVAGSEFCADSILYLDTVQLAPIPAANFELNTDMLCHGDSVLFINRSTAINEVVSSLVWKIDPGQYTGQELKWRLNEGELKVRLIAGTENGCFDSLDRQFTVNPSVEVELTADTLICSGSLINLKARILKPVDGASFVWRENENFLCEDCFQLGLRPDTSSVYTFEAKHPNGCLSVYESRISTFRNPIGLLSMTPDTIICHSAIIPIQANANENVYSYQWDVSKPGLSCYTNCRNPIAAPDTTTTYIVTVSNGQGCERIDSLTIYVNYPGGINLGADRTICRGDSFQINAPGYRDYRWTGSSGISCTNCENPILLPVSDALYIVHATEDGCPVTDSIRLHIFSGKLIEGRKDTTVCIGSPVQLRTVNLAGLTWLPSLWISDVNQKNPSVQPNVNAVFYVQTTQDLCSAMDSFKVNVLSNTEIIGRDRTVCPGEEFTLNVQGEATSFQWTGPNILDGQNTNTIRSNIKQPATYTVIAKNLTCSSDTAVIKVGIISFLDLPETIQVQVVKSLPYQLNKTLKPDSLYQYSWTPGDGLSCTDCLRPFLFTDTSKTYIFQIFDPSSGCELTQEVNVQLIDQCSAEDYFSVPNIFTPNQDGVNDQFFIIPKAVDQIKSFRIFDRTGDLVFETFDISVGWDGRFRNTEAANGVYVYLIEAECPQLNQRIILSGDITLLR